MMGLKLHEPDFSEFVEVDPTGRYGRYNEILGKGASKTVYKAFDEFEGIEVAWNQVKLQNFLQSPEDLERLYCEIHLLKTLKHKNIMKFYTSWVDTENRNINFVTEMFTSGTLRQYRQKHRRVNIRAVKHWCRQILRGLLYLHSHDPPIIHRDLKCDNIFVNGNQGEVKIGDLGLAAILRKSHAAHCVGTPEFMAPEIYEEQYNELVDIYSFGMCLLEMVTFEYPYSECTHPAQIYKKVISGKKPEALYRVQDPEVRQFIEKCLVTAARRLPARELLKDPFLRIDDSGSDLRIMDFGKEPEDVSPFLRQPLLEDGIHNNFSHENEYELDYSVLDAEPTGYTGFSSHDDESCTDMDISIKGKQIDDVGIFLRLRIADKEGHMRNIYFPFDIEADTAISVATEMVAELDIMDQDVTKIAEMIDGEISGIVSNWKPGPAIEENHGFETKRICHNCASNSSSNSSLLNYLSSNNHVGTDQRVLRCSRPWCAAMHGRFEEITYEGSEHSLTEGAPVVSSQSDGLRYTDIWSHHDLSSQGSRGVPSDEEHEELVIAELDCSPPTIPSLNYDVPDDYDNEIRQGLRWLKEKYQVELRELSLQQLGSQKSLISSPLSDRTKHRTENIAMDSLSSRPLQEDCDFLFSNSSGSPNHTYASFPIGNYVPNKNSSHSFDGSYNQNCSPDSWNQRMQNCVAKNGCSKENFYTAKSFYTGSLISNSLQRSQSLPFDAVDV